MKRISGRKSRAIFNRNSNRTKSANLTGKVRRGGLYF